MRKIGVWMTVEAMGMKRNDLGMSMAREQTLAEDRAREISFSYRSDKGKELTKETEKSHTNMVSKAYRKNLKRNE